MLEAAAGLEMPRPTLRIRVWLSKPQPSRMSSSNTPARFDFARLFGPAQSSTRVSAVQDEMADARSG